MAIVWFGMFFTLDHKRKVTMDQNVETDKTDKICQDFVNPIHLKYDPDEIRIVLNSWTLF